MSSPPTSDPTAFRAPRLGEATSTSDGYSAGIKLFDAWQISRTEPSLADLTAAHVAHDHLLVLLTSFARYMGHTNIPHANGKTDYISVATKDQYFSKVKEALRNKFRTHSFWTNEKDWTQLRIDFKKHAERHGMMADDISDSKIAPLYKKIDPSSMLVRSSQLSITNVDLTKICLALLKQGETQKRLELVLLNHAAGRGGEHYLLRRDEAQWDPRLRCLDLNWHILKQLDSQCMIMVPEKRVDEDSFTVDFYHSLGTYFSLDKGLLAMRYNPAKRKFVFPSLHDNKKENVAKALTGAIRSVLDMPKSEKSRFSTRSVRMATATELAAHQDISVDERVNRGGWTSGQHKNANGYVEANPALSKPGGMALAGFDDCHQEVYPPSLLWLGTSVRNLDQFVKHLFAIDVPFFQPDGPLRPLLETCAASLVMYHNDAKQKLGSQHPIVKKLIAAGKAANINDASCPPGTSTSIVLDEWSTRMVARFQLSNPDTSIPSAKVQEKLTEQSRLIINPVRRLQI